MPPDKSKIAVLMLACSDYEAMEVALACHMVYGNAETPFFILQNCRGTYDDERTLEVARRYALLFPGRIRVIDHLPPDVPYRSIARVLESDLFVGFDLVCKVDDDAFPITPGWLDRLLACWTASEAAHGSKLAYVTPLINNNYWGFAETIRALGLEAEYFERVSEAAYGVSDADISEQSVAMKTVSHTMGWGAPHLARWIHERTTLDPDRFVEATRLLPPARIPSGLRYSIGCILFRPSLWKAIDNGALDDEAMMQAYCASDDVVTMCEASLPFVHLAYFHQRSENRDVTERARATYEARLNLPFPIASRASRLVEIEERLRWLETGMITSQRREQKSVAAGIHGLSPEMLGVRALKGIFQAMLFKLGLRSSPLP